MVKSRKIVVILLVLVLAITMLIIPTACTTKENAIIILPGIMGSNLIDGEEGRPLWAPISGLNMHEMDISDITKLLKDDAVKDLLDLDGEYGAFNWIEKMSMNNDGSSKYNIVTQSLDKKGKPKYENASTYGTLEYYEKLYKALYEKYNKTHDVILFEYDWRLDVSVSADKLQEFINSKKYKNVSIVAHSMGGLVTSSYLAKSEDNRNKIDKVITLGTPYLGALKALRVPEDPLSLLDSSFDNVFDMVKRIVESLNKDIPNCFDMLLGQVIDLVRTFPSMYQMVPYEAFMGAYNIEGDENYGSSFIIKDGEPMRDYKDIVEFLTGREFNQDVHYIEKIIDWQKLGYVEKDGKLVHATTLVNTTYFVGTNIETEYGIIYENGKMTGVRNSTLGDGTVPTYSASCGLPLNDERVVVFDKVSHGDLSYNDICIDKIFEIIG